MKFAFLFLFLPFMALSQADKPLAFCFKDGRPMITNAVVRDVGLSELGGVRRQRTLELKCPKCKARQTVSQTIWVEDKHLTDELIRATNGVVKTKPFVGFQDRRKLPVIPRKL